MERMRATPSVRISQSIIGVKADGSRVPLPGDLAHPVSMDEVYEKLSYLYSRYRLIAHFSLPESKAGDLIMLYDGEHSYRYRTWTNEVYRPYHDELCKRNSKPNEYCSDNYWEALESIAALYAAYPRGRGNGEVYSYVGRHEADGRSIIELAHKDDAVKGFEQHVYLDEATYLPNRITTYGFGGSFNDLLRQRGYVGYERTFTRFQLGESVSEGDFSLELPTNVITVYDEVGQVYTNTRQVAQEVDFALFEPPGGTEQIKYLDVPYIVEKDGQKSPILRLSAQDLTIKQGSYMPTEAYDVGGYVGEWPYNLLSKVDINGQTATVRSLLNGAFHSLAFERAGTTIVIIGNYWDENNEHERELAIELARSLQPVKKSP